MFCKTCGQQVADNERFCPNCGAALAGPQAAPQAPQQPPRPQQAPRQGNVPNLGMTPSSALPLSKLIVYITLAALYVLLIPFWFIHIFSTGSDYSYFGGSTVWVGMSNIIATFYTIITIIAFVAAAAATILPIFKINLSFNKNLIIQKVVTVWTGLCFFLVTFNGQKLTVWGVFFIIFVVGTVACFVALSMIEDKKIKPDTFKKLTR